MAKIGWFCIKSVKQAENLQKMKIHKQRLSNLGLGGSNIDFPKQLELEPKNAVAVLKRKCVFQSSNNCLDFVIVASEQLEKCNRKKKAFYYYNAEFELQFEKLLSYYQLTRSASLIIATYILK